jgi:hypothetical protein
MASDPQTTAATFHYRLNGGAEKQIEVNTGIYQFAALAIPAVTGETNLPMVIEMIWCPRFILRVMCRSSPRRRSA